MSFVNFKSRIPDVITGIHEKLVEATDDTTKDLAHLAAQMAPKDTTSLEWSIYVVTHQESGYAQAVELAENVNKNAVIIDEVSPPDPSKIEAKASSAVAHSVYQELGTVRQPAQPYFSPAATAMEQPYVEAVKHAVIEGAKP